MIGILGLVLLTENCLCYVGQTCNLSERWRNNGKNYFNSIKFYNAIKKYGWDNFTHEVVYSNLNKQAADKLEKELIHKYNSIEEGFLCLQLLLMCMWQSTHSIMIMLSCLRVGLVTM